MERALRELAALPEKRRTDRFAGRVVALWTARRARGAEPLFAPTIGAAIRARRPWLSFICPGCRQVGDLDLRAIDRHPHASIESLIPALSCRRCSPNPPFVKLIGLHPRPGGTEAAGRS